MSMQGWVVLGAAAVAIVFFARRFRRNLAGRGKGAGCGSCGDACGCEPPKR
jgi:hypothetical protein